jgi:peptide/nickel transport system substrate-binding protein
MLVERWEVDKADKNVWTFHQSWRQAPERRVEFTSADVIHSVDRINNDPQASRNRTSARSRTSSLDKYTVKIVTKEPTASLLIYFRPRHHLGEGSLRQTGARDADRKYPWGWGPYKLKELVIGQRIALEKELGHPDVKPENPDTLIFNIMREPEQRVTALLNNEIQIAQFVPPHLAERVKSAPNAELHPASSVEIMFLAMSPKYKPWDNPNLRQALCYAIDRDLIIKNVLKGQADRLDGPIGPGQYGYDPEYTKKNLIIFYDPAKARELVKASGYNKSRLSRHASLTLHQRQGSDRGDSSDAQRGRDQRSCAQNGRRCGPTCEGQTPFYYMGRGSVVDPSVALSQFRDQRIAADQDLRPEIDRTLAAERVTFDPANARGSQHRIQGDRGCGAGLLHVAHHMLYGHPKRSCISPTRRAASSARDRRQAVARGPLRANGYEFSRCFDTCSADHCDDSVVVLISLLVFLLIHAAPESCRSPAVG